MFEIRYITYAFQVLDADVVDVLLRCHDARVAPYALVTHAVERVGLHTVFKDIVYHLPGRPVEHGAQKVVGVFLAECQHVFTTVGMVFVLAVLVLAVGLHVIFEIGTLLTHLCPFGTLCRAYALYHQNVIVYFVEYVVNHGDCFQFRCAEPSL